MGCKGMTAEAGAATLAEQAFGVLQRAIVGGELHPGSRLKIADLENRFGLGATPLREGLSRLVSLGFVAAVGQRGFRVAEMSPEDLMDITLARSAVEVEALRLSMAQGDARWEGEILSCLHQMSRCLADVTDMADTDQAFEDIHKSFHLALIGGCGSPRLVGLSSNLHDQAFRYRRAMRKRGMTPPEFIKEHQSLADLVLSRKSDEACALLKLHLASTYKAVYGAM